MESVVLAEVRTPCELQAVTEWAAKARPDAPVVTLDDLDVGRFDTDTTMVPARVVWLPPVRRGERRVSVADVLALSNPRRPPAFRQGRIKGRHPDRVRVVQGEPASLDELRTRYEQQSAAGQSFTAFVARQASLTGERAERQVIGDRYKVPRLVADQISSSARFQGGAAALARELGRPAAAVAQEATDKMSTFVATQSRLMDDLFSSIFSNLHDKTWSVSVDMKTFDQLRTINKSASLVFLPSHRSYVDPLVLSEVLRSHDFPPNLVLGGNNLSFWPVGPIAQRAGMIFIRRKFGKDAVYKFAMRSYLSFIIEKRFNLEWYIEGGRSRTGKLRKPMLGLLHYVVDAVEQLDGADAMVVPTAIVYDQLQEIGAMAKESAGGTKKPEGVGWLLKYAKAQRTYLGEARVRFGEPFSLRQALEDAGDGSARLEKVAFRVMDEINAATAISATSLAGFALLGASDRAYTCAEIEEILEPLLKYIDDRGLPGPDPALCRGLGLRSTLRVLTREEVLSRFDGGPEPVWSIASGNHAVAAYYRNGALHHFVNRSIVELGLLAATDGDFGDDLDSAEEILEAAREEAMRLRDLLKFEFFFPAKEGYIHRLAGELDLLDPQWRDVTPTSVRTEKILREHAGALFARRTLQPFFDAQLVVADLLVHLGAEDREKEALLTDALGLGQQLSLQGIVKSKDSVSKELYDAAYLLADNRGLVGAEDRSGVSAGRRAWLHEVQQIRSRLARIATIEAEQNPEPLEVPE
ncbi:glycerol-3-phosphate 1-O-acyltransferase [Williamsia sterculiae]|uniref:glycerol-3-phosphate 1-O-acyltransferase n=1 Tax=Williamsia sterculiae TaxID=1344003 RepID=UPI0009714365|nr:glycerol-3-phosphate 1-O-acyltransferase [Williamsia sterculiae]